MDLHDKYTRKDKTFQKNQAHQKLHQEISEKNRATNYRFRYRGTNSVNQPYE